MRKYVAKGLTGLFILVAPPVFADGTEQPKPTLLTPSEENCLEAFSKIALDDTSSVIEWQRPSFTDETRLQTNLFINADEGETKQESKIFFKAKDEDFTEINVQYKLSYETFPRASVDIQVNYTFEDGDITIASSRLTAKGGYFGAYLTPFAQDSFDGILESISFCVKEAELRPAIFSS